MTSARNFGLEVAGMSGKEELVRCPFHEDNKPSAWFNPEKELFYCAVCNLGLNAMQLAKRLGVVVELDDEPTREPEDYNLLDDNIHWELGIPVPDHPYFQSRHILPNVIEIYGVRYSVIQKAAVLPTTNLKGDILGVNYRYLHPEAAGTRYRVLGETQPLWPMHLLHWLSARTKLLVFEGAWSAMRVMSYIVRHQVKSIFLPLALLGAKANQEIIDTVHALDSVFIYDGDVAGKHACHKMRRLAPAMKSFTYPVSPDDMDDAQIEELFTKLERL